MRIMRTDKTYLSDGVYVHSESESGYPVVLTTQRTSGEDAIYLEDVALRQLFHYIEKTCNVRISVERVQPDEKKNEE